MSSGTVVSLCPFQCLRASVMVSRWPEGVTIPNSGRHDPSFPLNEPGAGIQQTTLQFLANKSFQVQVFPTEPSSSFARNVGGSSLLVQWKVKLCHSVNSSMDNWTRKSLEIWIDCIIFLQKKIYQRRLKLVMYLISIRTRYQSCDSAKGWIVYFVETMTISFCDELRFVGNESLTAGIQPWPGDGTGGEIGGTSCSGDTEAAWDTGTLFSGGNHWGHTQ